ncbi:unnamed protein product [Fusarium graminearum]|nr:unnamed protein product [Fusarium graminearum]
MLLILGNWKAGERQRRKALKNEAHRTYDSQQGMTWANIVALQATSIKSIRALAPLLDRVLVQRIKAETKTASGIFLPESSVEKLNEAKVLAVGPGALDKKGNRLPMGVTVGDRVLIPQFGGSPVKAGEEEFQLFRDSEILAKINE